MTVPTLAPEQRRQGLVRAQEAREARAALLAALKGCQAALEDVFDLADAGDRTAARTPVLVLLRAFPGVGPATARKLLLEAKVSDSRRVQGLGRFQRRALLDGLARRGL
jgi:guanylate kinase